MFKVLTSLSICFIQASAPAPAEGLFKNVLTNNAATVARDDRLRGLYERCEAATTYGSNLPSRLGFLRAAYCRDSTFMVDSLTRLGTELKAFPGIVGIYYFRYFSTILLLYFDYSIW